VLGLRGADSRAWSLGRKEASIECECAILLATIGQTLQVVSIMVVTIHVIEVKKIIMTLGLSSGGRGRRPCSANTIRTQVLKGWSWSELIPAAPVRIVLCHLKHHVRWVRHGIVFLEETTLLLCSRFCSPEYLYNTL